MQKVISWKSKRYIKKLLPDLKEKLIKQKIKIGKPIAEGSYSIAYLAGSKTVLKITTDKAEVRTSSKLVGKRFKNIGRIFRVFEYSSVPDIYIFGLRKPRIVEDILR